MVIHMNELIYKPQYSLIEQAIHTDEAKMTGNGYALTVASEPLDDISDS